MEVLEVSPNKQIIRDIFGLFLTCLAFLPSSSLLLCYIVSSPAKLCPKDLSAIMTKPSDR